MARAWSRGSSGMGRDLPSARLSSPSDDSSGIRADSRAGRSCRSVDDAARSSYFLCRVERTHPCGRSVGLAANGIISQRLAEFLANMTVECITTTCEEAAVYHDQSAEATGIAPASSISPDGRCRIPFPDLRTEPTPHPRWPSRRGEALATRYRARARRLTAAQETAIRTLAGTKSLRLLAADFGVSHETIRAVVR
jgi:hypothetical protein